MGGAGKHNGTGDRTGSAGGWGEGRLCRGHWYVEKDFRRARIMQRDRWGRRLVGCWRPIVGDVRQIVRYVHILTIIIIKTRIT